MDGKGFMDFYSSALFDIDFRMNQLDWLGTTAFESQKRKIACSSAKSDQIILENTSRMKEETLKTENDFRCTIRYGRMEQTQSAWLRIIGEPF